jgi:hypothetical protein
MQGGHGALIRRIVGGTLLAWLLLCAPAFAAVEKAEYPGLALSGCTGAVTIEAATGAGEGTFTASLTGCTSGEIEYTLSGTFEADEVTLGAVKAKAKIAGQEVLLEQTLGYRFSVAFEIARAVKAGKTAPEEAEAKAAATRILSGSEKELITLAAERLLGKATGLNFQHNISGLLAGEQAYCAGFEGKVANEPGGVCAPAKCPSGCSNVSALTTAAGEESGEESRLALCPTLNAPPQETIDFVCVPTFVSGTLNTKAHPIVLLPGGALVVTPKSVTGFKEATTIQSSASITSLGGLLVGDDFKLKAPKIELAGGVLESFGELDLEGAEKVSLGSVELGDIAAEVPLALGTYVANLQGWANVLDAVSKEGPATFPAIPTSGSFALPARVSGATLAAHTEQFALDAGSELQTHGLGGLGQALGATHAPGGERERFGGSHGGYGGYPQQNFSGEDFAVWHTLTNRATTFDSPFSPKLPGDGGAGEHEGHDEGTPGGGVVTIDTTAGKAGARGSVALDGRIDVSGFREVKLDGGGAGAGGSVTVETGRLSGAGVIDANGGDDLLAEAGSAGTGAGGRIASLYEDDSGFTGAFEARGGYDQAFAGLSTNSAGDGSAGAGTIFERQVIFTAGGAIERGQGVFPQGTLRIDGGLAAGHYPPPDGTPIEKAWSSPERRLVLEGEARGYATNAEYAEIDVLGGSTLTTPSESAESRLLSLLAKTIHVGPASQITTTGRGYAGGSKAIEPSPGETGGGEPAAGGFGGSHGGVGGADVPSGGSAPAGAHAGSTYDSAEHPLLAGAGGGGVFGVADGSPGGGVLNIQSQTLIDEGLIAADGGSTSGPTATDPTPFDHSAGGAGAGGSVLVETAALSGSGTISAAGGFSCLQLGTLLPGGHEACLHGLSGAGGGGRIVLHTETACEWTGGLDVAGGSEDGPGLTSSEQTLSAGTAGSIFPANPTTVGSCSSPAQPPPGEPERSSPPVIEIKVPPAPKSPGTLSAVAKQKLGATLTVSFLCKASHCAVTVTATIKAGKKRFSVVLKNVSVKQGQKSKLALKLTKKERALIGRAFAKHQTVTVAVLASVTYSEGRAKAGPLGIKLQR